MMKKMLLDREEQNWPDVVSTIAWNMHVNVHKLAKSEPIHLLIGQRPRFLQDPECQCRQLDLNITKNPDLSEKEVDKITDNATYHNLSALLSFRPIKELNADVNIKKVNTETKNF